MAPSFAPLLPVTSLSNVTSDDLNSRSHPLLHLASDQLPLRYFGLHLGTLKSGEP